MMVTVCDRQSVNSIREDDENVDDVTEPVEVTVTDVEPPSAHAAVMVCDRPSGETDIAVLRVAWFTAAATIPSVAELPGPAGIAAGAVGLWPPQPARRPRMVTNAATGQARIAAHSSRIGAAG